MASYALGLVQEANNRQRGAAFAAPSEVDYYTSLDYDSRRKADCGSEFA